MGRTFPSDIDEPDAPFSTHFFRSQIALKLLLQASLLALERSPLKRKTHARNVSRDDRASLVLRLCRQAGVVATGKLRRPGAAFRLSGGQVRRHPWAVVSSMLRGLHARFLLSSREHQPAAAGMRRGICRLPCRFRLAHRCQRRVS